MTLKADYTQAYSALRWLTTYDPHFDYWDRHYPNFDETRRADDELLALPPLAVGMAYQSQNMTFYPPKYRAGRYLEKHKAKRNTKTYYMVSKKTWERIKAEGGES